MKVCFCVHRLPYPPVGGGKRETYKFIEGLADRGHDVEVVAYGDDPDRADEMERRVGCSLTLVPGLPDRTPSNLARNLLSTAPLPVTKARTGRFERAARRGAERADVLHLHALQTSFLASALDVDVPTVLRFNNVKFEIYRQFAGRARNPAKACYAYLQYAKTRRFEASIPGSCDLALTITDEDRQLLLERGAPGPVDVLPAGVDVARFSPSGIAPDERTVTFFGSMDYHPNEDAAIRFADDVFPRIRREFADATFEIVGKNPSRAVQRLGDRDGIRVTGFVESIRDYVERATVIVLPIRVGTGVRMKALHAMAMGKPIVSTPLGVQGIRIEDGRHAVVADADAAFVRSVTDLLADPDRRERYGREAREFATANHDWSTILPQLEAYYETVTAPGIDAPSAGR